ncbi:hypothetical protein SAMN05444374_10182 [Rhodococcoides kroppenstedtii]|uniref:Uncharacterized protein n=2 Tax=Rhodococcoides kroppenstedtii TaxID=293050 RepID=A0A1I0SFB0_9NOCA|nr:hypothetical protein SAMN05444374_10182 [Rhodococcus kroppenstedtii]
MHRKDTPTDRLVTELEAVTTNVLAQFVDRRWEVNAFLTSDHSGPHIAGWHPATDHVWVIGTGPTLAAAMDDALGKVALSAPQAVTA